ncbi:MAG: DUF4065 domain-containing protein [Alphaproteobacteria bacterium]|nr:DUF4065 domain-containing protein [Alphaproteobacteria bacterium]
MRDSRTVANRFITLANAKGDALTPMQILKLVYMAHGWMLGLVGRPLIKEEVEAWQYGPVIPKLYNAIRRYKSQPVSEAIQGLPDDLAEDETHIIDQVYKIYGKRSGPALSRLTHKPDSPWAKVYRPGSFGLEIPNDLIEDHYAMLAKRAQEAA